ncbi:hypothetical protein DL766_005243 [Monosporascus sp. MC13-8B]|uniref:Cytochrome b5 heme-binding domain-containing protein n=1 Tax=Monosporascus cannonballus TaxID=155416 RepID=A0ABY0HB33_9PEZI|nr:hypothetical protein DL762_004344 [Monosporascus cannonballus]RYO99263.1 hypothetical protein DL763_001627 [Monosporascus cannonballus]RYP29702.1 hypothetical protein DL766_005243 [Monosporascus sp. MC13-8B]
MGRFRQIYDLTGFASDHPGGIDVLKDTAGTDATESFEYAGHTAGAIATMAKFQVGKLEGSEVEEFAPPTKVSLLPSPHRKKTESIAKSDGGDLRAWIRPVTLLLALAAGSVLPALVKEGPRLIAALPSLTLPSLQAGQEADATFPFIAGLFLAGSAGLSVLVYIYWRFNRTLEHEKSVFLYPPVIPRGTTSLGI